MHPSAIRGITAYTLSRVLPQIGERIHTKEQMDELTGKYYETNMFIDYKADVERPCP